VKLTNSAHKHKNGQTTVSLLVCWPLMDGPKGPGTLWQALWTLWRQTPAKGKFFCLGHGCLRLGADCRESSGKMDAEDLMQLEVLGASPNLTPSDIGGVLLGNARQFKFSKGENLFSGIVEKRMKAQRQQEVAQHESLQSQAASPSEAEGSTGELSIEKLEHEWRTVHALHDEVSGLKADIQLGKLPGEPQV
jgi:hypothetical protein